MTSTFTGDGDGNGTIGTVIASVGDDAVSILLVVELSEVVVEPKVKPPVLLVIEGVELPNLKPIVGLLVALALALVSTVWNNLI